MKIRFNIVLGQVSFLRWTNLSARFIFISLQFYPIVHINVKSHSVYIPALIGCHIRFSLIPYGFLDAVVAHTDGDKSRIQNIGAVALRIHPAIDHLLWGGVFRRNILPRSAVPDSGVVQDGKAGTSILPGVVKERGKFFDPHLGRCVDGVVGLQGGKPLLRPLLNLTSWPFMRGAATNLTGLPLPLWLLHTFRHYFLMLVYPPAYFTLTNNHNRAKSNAGGPLHYFFDIILKSQKLSKNRERFPIRYNAAKDKECK